MPFGCQLMKCLRHEFHINMCKKCMHTIYFYAVIRIESSLIKTFLKALVVSKITKAHCCCCKDLYFISS